MGSGSGIRDPGSERTAADPPSRRAESVGAGANPRFRALDPDSGSRIPDRGSRYQPSFVA